MLKVRSVKILALVLALGVLAFALVGCGGQEGQEEAKGKVRIPYVEWECATASSNVMKVILEDMGYEVDLMSVGAAAMWQGVAAGEADGFTTAWLPLTHNSYLEETEGDLEVVAKNFEGARIGLMVPSYVDIDSIEELNDNADKFDNQIIGIDPGAGIMEATEKALTEYGLSDMDLVEGSDAIMVGALADAIDKEEWVVVTGWVPHWKDAKWDLKFLEDPKTIYGEAEDIYSVVRLGLEEDMPEVYEVFKNFHWEGQDIGTVMEAENPADGARKWVDDNQDIVQQWLPQ
ncbi:MAG: glycine betaine ABC transporter substrate-binding protein [Clostridia bacterium]|nr:glycine betaine ABC transporter substrate-binding protein [Clostridia bacterium]